MSHLVGYARTSTLDQAAGLDAQVRDLTALGCTKVFHEQVSSIGHRPSLEAMLDYVREGDTVICTKLDRLARSVTHLWEIVGKLQAKGVALRIEAMGIDTNTPTGKLMLNVLGGVAQFERHRRKLAALSFRRATSPAHVVQWRSPCSEAVRRFGCAFLGDEEGRGRRSIRHHQVWRGFSVPSARHANRRFQIESDMKEVQSS